MSRRETLFLVCLATALIGAPTNAAGFPDRYSVGRCPEGLATGSYDPFHITQLTPLLSWLEARDLGPSLQPPRGARKERGDWVGIAPLSAAAFLERDGAPLDRRKLAIERSTAQAARRETRLGATLLVGVNPDGFATSVASRRPDGSVAFLGACAAVHTVQLDTAVAYLASKGVQTTAVAALGQLIVNDRGDVGRAFRRIAEGPSWYEVAPRHRTLNPADAPPEVLETLWFLNVYFELPPSWRGLRDATICTRTSIGWNDCTQPGFLPLDLAGYAVPGEELEIWALGTDANPDKPIARLGAVPAAVLAEAAGAPGTSVRVAVESAVAERASDLAQMAAQELIRLTVGTIEDAEFTAERPRR